MRKQSIIFLGSKSIGYECLKYLIDQSISLSLDIKAVLWNGSGNTAGAFNLQRLAEANAIPVLTSPDDMPEVDFLYSVQYHRILTEDQIARAAKLAVNLHMAPLPDYRGCNQFSFAILDQQKEFGTTIHQIDPRIDHGDILFEKRFPIPPQCWISDLYQMTYDASLALFKETLTDITAGNYSLTPQAELIQQRGSQLHYRNEIDEIKRIDLNWDAERIERHIRATAMPGFEPPYAKIGDQKIYFNTAWR